MGSTLGCVVGACAWLCSSETGAPSPMERGLVLSAPSKAGAGLVLQLRSPLRGELCSVAPEFQFLRLGMEEAQPSSCSPRLGFGEQLPPAARTRAPPSPPEGAQHGPTPSAAVAATPLPAALGAGAGLGARGRACAVGWVCVYPSPFCLAARTYLYSTYLILLLDREFLNIHKSVDLIAVEYFSNCVSQEAF